MRATTLVQVLLSFFVMGACLTSYLSKQNDVTKLSMQIPERARTLKNLEEETLRLRYEIEQFENPAHLVRLVQSDLYSHLKHPSVDRVVVLSETPLPKREPLLEEAPSLKKPLFVIGAKP